MVDDTPVADLPVWGYLAVGVIAAAAAAPLFWSLSTPGLSDIYLHGEIILSAHRYGSLPTYTLLYPLVSLMTGGHAMTYDEVRPPLVGLLAVFMGLKVTVAWWALARVRAKRLATGLATVFVCIAAPLSLLFQGPFYLGKITPSIWHNSTTVLAMPFCVLMFILGVAYVREAPRRWYFAAAPIAAVVLGLLFKPNFGMVFLPTLGIYSLVRAIPDRRFGPVGRYMTIAAPAVAVLVFQYLGTYTSGSVPFRNVFAPLVLWQAFSHGQIPLSLLESLLLVVVGTVVLWRGAIDRASIVMAWVCLILAISLFALLGEVDATTGDMVYHGNWSWAMHPALFVLYVLLAREWLAQRSRLRAAVKATVYVLVVAYAGFGIHYLTRLIFFDYR